MKIQITQKFVSGLLEGLEYTREHQEATLRELQYYEAQMKTKKAIRPCAGGSSYVISAVSRVRDSSDLPVADRKLNREEDGDVIFA